MKFRLIYLLIFSTLFLGGCGYTRAMAEQQAGASFLRDQAVVTSLSNPVMPEQVSLFSDDNDNDDISSEKKKTFVSRCLAELAFQSLPLHTSGTNNTDHYLPEGQFHTSTPKYIFHRTLRV